MNFTRRTALALGASLAISGLSASAVAAADLEAIKSAGAVKIGMLVDFPPFGIMNEKNQPDGYDADVAKMLAKYLGVEVTLVPVTGPNRIPYLLSGQVDLLVASLGITPERAEKVDFSAPYAGIRVALYGDVNIDLSDAEKMTGHRIGVARASTQDGLITKVAPEGTDIKRFDDDATGVQALLSGQVDAIGASNTVIDQLEGMAGDRFEEKFELSQQVQGIALSKGSDALMAEVNAFIKDAKANGELNGIHEKWLGTPLPVFVAEK